MIAYLLKSASCLALLIFFYHFILEKEKMHNFNRFYLLGSILFSFLIPLATITIPSVTEGIETVQRFYNQPIFIKNTTPILKDETFDYTQIYIGIYFLISSILLIRFGKNLFKITQKIKLNKKIKHKKALLILVDDVILPHTFWNYIFINKKAYKEGKIEEELLTHELTHVTQKHTVDVLIIELLQILFWINPLFIFLKKAIQLNHEFLADEKVINLHKNTLQYQHLLLNKAAWNNEYYLTSNLNYLLTKKRLKMMTTQSSHTKVLLKKLTVILLLAGFVFLFAGRIEAQQKKEIIEIVSEQQESVQKTRLVTDIYKEYFYRNSFITSKDKERKKVKKKYSELSNEEKSNLPPPPPIKSKKKTPSKKLITTLKDSKNYAIWIDGKVVKNNVLNNYNNSDFSNYFVSFVHKNARSKNFPQKYQAHLDTHKYFKTENEKRKYTFEKWKIMQEIIKKAKWQKLPNGENIQVIEEPTKEYIDSQIRTNKSSNQSTRLILEDVDTLKINYKKDDNDAFFNTSTGFKIIRGKKHFFVKKNNSYNYYNRQGKLVNLLGKIVSNSQTNASDIIEGQYITKVYYGGKIVSEFKDNTPVNNLSDTEYYLEEIVESSTNPPPILPLNFVKKQKDKNVNYFYNGKKINYNKALHLLQNNRPIEIESKKVNGKMIINLSKKVKNK